MSNSATAGNAPQVPVAYREQRSVLIEFFRHHGAWAPGVKLFRRLGFKAKAAIISAVFLVPLAVVFTGLWQAKQDVIDFANKERQGVASMTLVANFYNELTNVRNATRATLGGYDGKADYAAAHAAAGKHLTALEDQVKKDGDPLLILPAVAKLRSAWVATDSAKEGVDERGRTVFGPVVTATRELLNKVGDDSNLVLDPDVDSFYLINAMVLAMPKVMEDTGQLWGWSTYAASKGSLERTQLRDFGVWSATTATGVRDLRDFVGRATTATASLKTRIDLTALDNVDAFQKLAQGAVLEGKEVDAARLYAAGKSAVSSLDVLFDATLPIIDELLQARIEAANRERTLFSLVVLAFVTAGAYLFYSFFLVTHGGLREVQRHLEAMTAGDLTTSPRPWGNDEAAHLMGSLADMQKSLRNIVTRVRGSSESLVHASSEIASASMDLSSRTEQTAANLEESASSMEEISSTVKNTSENSVQASRVAEGNAETAARGGSVIAQVVSTMHDINASSKRISEIIGTIDGIAFQTNILALNAAVEAARAGEQGRGFAVVASEVRSLAQRSAQAAKEIKTLITTSVERVESGTRIVQGAGDTMSELVSNAERMRSLLSEISTASSEQSNGVTQVGAAVQDLDKMTQQNAALVEQTAAAASSLRDQALDLANEVSRFKLPAHG